jgi:hypothetical protein
MDLGRTARIAIRTGIWIFAASVVTVPSVGAAEDVPRAHLIGQARLLDPTPARVEMLDWALDRYREAHLAVPAIDVRFHDDTSGCGGNVGYTNGRRVDLCVRLEMEPGPQRIVLHELAHAWGNVHLSDEARETFTTMRGLATWSSEDAGWKERGTEHAAEIVAWGVGDGTMLPLVSGDRDPAALADAFRILTAAEPLHAIA